MKFYLNNWCLTLAFFAIWIPGYAQNGKKKRPNEFTVNPQSGISVTPNQENVPIVSIADKSRRISNQLRIAENTNIANEERIKSLEKDNKSLRYKLAIVEARKQVISELEDSLRKYVATGETYRNQLSQTYELINQLKRDLESAKSTNEQYKKDIKSRDTYIQTLTTERDEAKQKIRELKQELNEITFLMGIRIKNFKPVSYGKNSLSFIYLLQQTQQQDETEEQPSIKEVEVVIWVFRKNKMGEQPQLVNNSSGSNRTREKRPIGDTIRFDFNSTEPIQALDELTGNCIEYIIRFQLIGKNCEIWNEEQPILDLTKIRKI